MVTRALLKSPITPNQISVLGILFAALGVVAMLGARGGGTVGAYVPQSRWWWLAAALCVQLRLLANMFDGLVAVEGGRGHPTGALYNELPDRVQDFLLLFGAGLAIGYPVHGLIVVLLATLCAYVRVVGGAIGLPQDYSGPMAKPHRMAALTLGCIGMVADNPLGYDPAEVMVWTLNIIGVGAIVTIVRRIWRMHRLLSASAP